jgi:hypothetical protein
VSPPAAAPWSRVTCTTLITGGSRCPKRCLRRCPRAERCTWRMASLTLTDLPDGQRTHGFASSLAWSSRGTEAPDALASREGQPWLPAGRTFPIDKRGGSTREPSLSMVERRVLIRCAPNRTVCRYRDDQGRVIKVGEGGESFLLDTFHAELLRLRGGLAGSCLDGMLHSSRQLWSWMDAGSLRSEVSLLR